MLEIIIGILGLLVGSFLNVVIYRLPRNINLCKPRSRCPKCKKTIPFWANIPVVSYLFLRGKCYYCKNHISICYPLVELLSCILSVFAAWHFGFGWQLFSSLLLIWSLIALTLIDLRHFILPDSITLPMIWLGLLINVFHVFASPASAIIGAVAGYMSLYLVAKAYKIIRHVDGMGYGDFKLLAMLGAWLGWQALPIIILIASFLGVIVGVVLILFKDKGRRSLQLAIPFGPFLAMAGIFALFFAGSLIWI